MNLDINKVIDTVEAYTGICLVAVTTDYSDFSKHAQSYHQCWTDLIALEKLIDIPKWIFFAPRISNAVANIHTKVEGNSGAWERRRRFLTTERDKMVESYKSSPTALKVRYRKNTIENNKKVDQFDDAIANVKDDFQTMGIPAKKKVFIVHGHNEQLKLKVYQYLIEEGFEPVILHLQANEGLTIIEKLEKNFNDVVYAIILYTSCDSGKANSEEEYNLRARQNVVFEHGYLISKLGRSNVAAIVEKGVEVPGDLSGLVYIPEYGEWRYELQKEMKKLR